MIKLHYTHRAYQFPSLLGIQCQAITWTNADFLSIIPLGANFSDIWNKNLKNISFMEMHLKMSSAKWRPFCPGAISVPVDCMIPLNFNTLRPRQNGRRFADDTFKRIFLNENVRTSIEISLKFVPKGPINNIPALVQIMGWRRSGDKPLSEPLMVSLLTHICVTWPQWVKSSAVRTKVSILREGSCVNSSPPGQNGRHFALFRYFQMHFREWKALNFD